MIQGNITVVICPSIMINDVLQYYILLNQCCCHKKYKPILYSIGLLSSSVQKYHIRKLNINFNAQSVHYLKEYCLHADGKNDVKIIYNYNLIYKNRSYRSYKLKKVQLQVYFYKFIYLVKISSFTKKIIHVFLEQLMLIYLVLTKYLLFTSFQFLCCLLINFLS